MSKVHARCDVERRLDIERIEDCAARWAGERFDLGPLERLVELHAGGVVTTRELALIFGLGVGGRGTVSRARSAGLTAVQADRWSIAAGFHPALVWGLQWYNEPVESSDDGGVSAAADTPAADDGRLASVDAKLDRLEQVLAQHAWRRRRARTTARPLAQVLPFAGGVS